MGALVPAHWRLFLVAGSREQRRVPLDKEGIPPQAIKAQDIRLGHSLGGTSFPVYYGDLAPRARAAVSQQRTAHEYEAPLWPNFSGASATCARGCIRVFAPGRISGTSVSSVWSVTPRLQPYQEGVIRPVCGGHS